MRKIVLLFCLFFAIANTSKATHLMGGEITWECIKSGANSGKYIFTVRVYRDCQGVAINTNMFLTAHNVPGLATIPLLYLGANDLSPSCDTIDGPNPAFSCNGTNIGYAGNGLGAVEEHIYQSEAIEIIGTPDANGWHFTWESCCRNSAIDNLAISGASFTLRAVMYSYIDSAGTVFPNGNTCFDSSPKFYEKPRTILEVDNGYDPLAFSNGFMYSHNAFDQERDSLSYEFAHPLNSGYDFLNPNSIAIPFNAPLSFTNPIPGIQMVSETGKTWYDATQQGNYVTCTKVSAFNCGQLVSEVYREIQVVIIPKTCNLGDTTSGNIGADTLCNIRPLVQPPFFFPLGSPQYQWDTIVHCGDTVSFDFIANDYDVYPNGSQQDLQFTVSGGQFMDYNVSPPALCDNPPCATFSETSTGVSPPFITAGGYGSGSFEWITSCNHIISTCGNDLRPSIYTFVINVQDDFCPAPAIENTAQVISITVCPPCDFLSAHPSTTPVTCALGYGSATVTPTNGMPPYTDFWFDMNGIPVNPDSLMAGDYEVRVRDSSMCETIDTVTVISLVPLMSSNVSSSNVSCFGLSDGSASIVAGGGVDPYSYLWSNGLTSTALNNLSAGVYTVSITDSNNCTIIDSITIAEPAMLVPTLTSNSSSITGNSTGGTMPYTFEYWGPSGLIASSFNNFGTAFSINPAQAGTYTFVVVDVNGCSDSVSIIYSANFSPDISVSLSNTWCDSLTSLTIDVIQDSGEVDMSTALFQSNAGSFDIASMNVGDTIGTATLMAAGGTININAFLIVSAIVSSSQVIIQPTSINNGNLGNFTVSNNPLGGIEILSQTVPDGNSYTAGNMNSVTFNNVFINPCVPLVFTSTINSELGDVDIQTFSFVVSDVSDIFNDLRIFPNPVSDILFISATQEIPYLSISIYDVKGQKIFSNYNLRNTLNTSLDISYLSSSVYLLVVESENISFSQTFIKE
tara:strand:- start:11748 stop:14642 length:2895 start_codon:yes stop_codon:yes gene_type:complete